MLPDKIRIATRKSPLAIWQAEHVAQQLRRQHPGLQIELVKMTTRGDQILDTALTKVGGKGLFVKELELGLLENTADIAVHSMKDVPMAFPDGLDVAVILERENPLDAFVSARYDSLESMPTGAVVGTSSLRRASQIMARLPSLKIKDCRGNVNTRLDKLENGDYDAIILAAAGLVRLGMQDKIASELPISESLPAIGQGAIGIECRSDDDKLLELLKPLDHGPTHACVAAERALNSRLGGSCEIPIAGHATISQKEIHLRGLIASENGSRIFTAECDGADPGAVGNALAESLLEQGAGKVLQSLGLPGT